MHWNNGFIVKTNKKGNVIWHKEVVGIDNLIFHSVIESGSNGYIVVGHSFTESQDYYTEGEVKAGGGFVAKFDKSGNMVWHFLVGTGFSSITGTYLKSVVEISDGEYLAIGSDYSTNTGDEYSSGLLLKFNDEGHIIWTKNYKVNNQDTYFDNIIKTTDNHVVISGSINYNDNRKTILTKMDQQGNIIWQEDIEDSLFINNIKELSDQGIILVNSVYSQEYQLIGNIIKYNKDGKKVWNSQFNQPVFFTSITEDKDGNILCLTRFHPYYFVKYNKNGKKLWSSVYEKFSIKTVNGDMGIYEFTNMIILKDGTQLLMGSYSSDSKSNTNSYESIILKLVEEDRWYDIIYNKYPIITKTVGYLISLSFLMGILIVFITNRSKLRNSR